MPERGMEAYGLCVDGEPVRRAGRFVLNLTTSVKPSEDYLLEYANTADRTSGRVNILAIDEQSVMGPPLILYGVEPVESDLPRHRPNRLFTGNPVAVYDEGFIILGQLNNFRYQVG